MPTIRPGDGESVNITPTRFAIPGMVKLTFPTNGLHLCETAINKQLQSHDVAAVIGCERDYGLRDLIRGTEPAERRHAGHHPLALVARF